MKAFISLTILFFSILALFIGCNNYQLPQATIVQHFIPIYKGDTLSVDVSFTSNGVDTICTGIKINNLVDLSECKKIK